jgi:Kef-type K+ transport system membrane component KefB
LYELFSPFFFIGIGLNLDPKALITAGGIGVVLLIVAVISKIAAIGGSVLLTTKWTGALLLGVSMIPRAEIAMIVMQRGLHEGDWAVSPQIYAAMVMISAATCLFSPIIIRLLLQKWPQTPEEKGGQL